MTEGKKAEKKNKILDTAIELFQKNSVSSTAVDDIVKAAGIARGTFYLYFRDKSDLLEQIIMLKSRETMVEMMKESVLDVAASDRSFDELTEIILSKYIELLCKNRDVLTIIQKNMSMVMKNAPDFGDETTNAVYELVVSEMIKNGYTRETATKIIYLVVDMVASICSDAILTGKPFTIDEIKPFVLMSAKSLIEHGKEFDRNNETGGAEE